MCRGVGKGAVGKGDAGAAIFYNSGMLRASVATPSENLGQPGWFHFITRFPLGILPVLFGLVVGESGCTAPYFANLARDFSGTLTSPSSDLSPMLRGITSVCRHHADLFYLRARIEDPDDRQLVPFQDRFTAGFSHTQNINARCTALGEKVKSYQLLHQVLLAYGSALRSLAETEGVDYHDSFQQVGLALNRAALQVRPTEPELGSISLEGADSISKLLRIGLSVRSEADIRKAIRAAALPVKHILAKLETVKDTYADGVAEYVNASRALMAEAERATQALPRGASGRRFDVLSYYHMALHNEDEIAKLQATAQVYRAILKSLRASHEHMVDAANSRVPAKEAFRAVRLATWDLTMELQYIYDDFNSLRQRENP